MRIIDADKLELDYDWSEYETDDGQVITNGYQAYSEEQIENAPTIEAIPKADYENRLKADMVAMLEELNLQIEGLFYRQRPFTWDDTGEKGMMDIRPSYDDICFLIQQKINALKEQTNENS